MKIIDKNTDYYDYWQDVYPDDTLVFDRRDSYLLTKDMFSTHLKIYSWWNKEYVYDINYALLQICNTFWLFNVNITNIDEHSQPTGYELILKATWKNYNKPRKLISLDIINFTTLSKLCMAYLDNNKTDTLVKMVDTNDYKVWSSIDKHTIIPGHDPQRKIEKYIPLLKACGIGELIDSLDIYLAFEEYFSLEKGSSERREPIGSTNNDKIEAHGFDTKTSFRGKN